MPQNLIAAAADGTEFTYGDATADQVSGETIAGPLLTETESGGTSDEGDLSASGSDSLLVVSASLSTSADTSLTIDPGITNVFVGSSGNDNFRGSDVVEIISGGAGNDRLKGEGGNDLIVGGEGNDTLNSGSGDDVLDGGAGTDTLTLKANAGADTIVFGLGYGVDTVRNFDISSDLIALDGFGIVDFSDVLNALSANQKTGGATLTFGTDTLILKGVSLENLSAENFFALGATDMAAAPKFGLHSDQTATGGAENASAAFVNILLDVLAPGFEVVLEAGEHIFDQSLVIDRDHITLKGAGEGGADGTTLIFALMNQDSGAITVRPNTDAGTYKLAGTTIVEGPEAGDVIAKGDTRIYVDNTREIEAGDVIYVRQLNTTGDNSDYLNSLMDPNEPNYDQKLAVNTNGAFREHIVEVSDVGTFSRLNDQGFMEEFGWIDLKVEVADPTIDGDVPFGAIPFDFDWGLSDQTDPNSPEFVINVKEYDLLEGVSLSDFSITYDLGIAGPDKHLFENALTDTYGWSQFENTAAVYVEGTYGATLERISVINTPSNAFDLRTSLNIAVDDLYAEGTYNKGGGGNGYGVQLLEVFNGSFENLEIFDMRHSFLFASYHAENGNVVHILDTNRDINFHGSPDLNNVVMVENSVLEYETIDGTHYALFRHGGAKHVLTDVYGEALGNSIRFDYAVGYGRDEEIHASDNDATLDGLGGDDILVSGAGVDTLIGGADIDTADYTRSSMAVDAWLTDAAVPSDPLSLTGGGADQGGVADDILVGIENLIGSKNAGDVLTGNSGDNILMGGVGGDTLDGGVGGSDTAAYSNATQRVDASLAASGGGTGDAHGDIYIGIENLTGSDFDDVLTGDAFDNVLMGGPGGDLLRGGGGSDTAAFSNYFGVTAWLTDAADAFSTTGGGADDGDVFDSIENLTGSDFDDHLTGNSADNILFGGVGNDVLIGGGGADVLHGWFGYDTADYSTSTWTGGESASLALNKGLGEIGSDSNGDLFNRIENLVGSMYDDELIGNSRANILSGGGGNDLLTGGLGSDTLEGGQGIDTAVYSGVYLDYQITSDGGGFDVSGGASGSDTDQLTDVEFVQFDDQVIDLSNMIA